MLNLNKISQSHLLPITSTQMRNIIEITKIVIKSSITFSSFIVLQSCLFAIYPIRKFIVVKSDAHLFRTIL